MTDGLDQSPEEIVTEISMSECIKQWLIVEGTTDGVFFSTKDLPNSPATRVANGWMNVDIVVSKVIEEGIRASVIGFVDRDYREELGIKIDKENIIMTDFRDLEISLFESTALHRLLVEYGLKQKLPEMPCGTVDVEQIKKQVYEVASDIGKLRYYSQKEQKHYPLKKLNYSKIICKKTLSIDKEKLVAQINSSSDTSKISIDILNSALEEDLPHRLRDVRNLCSGHDVIEILGISLKNKWGSGNSATLARESLERYFRIGYSHLEFSDTEMCRKLNTKLKSSVH